jgi:hypothetical protein
MITVVIIKDDDKRVVLWKDGRCLPTVGDYIHIHGLEGTIKSIEWYPSLIGDIVGEVEVKMFLN